MSQGWFARWGVLLILVLFVVGIFAVRDILLPFLVGMAVAYLLDPAADRLERAGFGRTTATVGITFGFFGIMVGALFGVLPILVRQAAELATELPGYFEAAHDQLRPRLASLIEKTPLAAVEDRENFVHQIAERGLNAVGATLARLLESGLAFINIVSLIFVTPVVTFYLLRDWDRMVAKIDELVPREYVATVRQLGTAIDDVLAGFLRGQAIVCGFLATFYAIGLWSLGLRYGLIIGLLTGFFSFVPYVGMALGLAVGVAVAVIQFQNPLDVGLVVLVFAVGQAIEGNFLTPKLVGTRIGLHPVWVIFAVLAGAALMGFVGALVAVPVAAVLSVLVRFALERYTKSDYYTPAS